MKKIFTGALILLSALSLFAEEFITVYREGNDFFVRSRFSETEDLVIQTWRYANENAFLIKRGAPLLSCKKVRPLHSSGDDYPAVPPLGGFGTLGGNHGSYYTRCVTAPGHGLTAKETGGIITDAKKNTYVILQVPDKDTLFIHPEGRPDTLRPRFASHTTAALFYKGKPLRFTKSVLRQLYPQNRITRWELLADGTTPVPEKKEIRCKFVDFIFVHDVLNTWHVVQSIKKDPYAKGVPKWGFNHSMCMVNTPELKEKYASYLKFPALVTYENKFRFQARGAKVNYRKITYHAALTHATNLDVMLGWSGAIAQQKKQFFYIPKLKPLTITDRQTKETRTIDLTAGIQIPVKMQYSYYIPRTDAADPRDLPDRFIRITGTENKYLYGVALGYSLFMGKTAKKNMPGDRDILYHLYKTHKMYPIAGTPKNILPGKTEEIVTYHQYFNPQLEPDATSFYCHYQGDSLMVYLDFHKELKNKNIKLPRAAEGKKITVIEKTPELTLHTQTTVPPSGITLSNNAKHGYLVLKLD